MGRPLTLCLSLLAVLLSVQFASSVDPPLMSPPSPAPVSGADSHSPVSSPPPNAGSPAHSPSPSVNVRSPPAPPPSDLVPGSSPPRSPVKSDSPNPSPAPSGARNVSHSDLNGDDGEGEEVSEAGGLSGKKKAGIAVAVIVAACVVVLGGVVYKKRQDNIRRSQYGYAARREIL